jgi:hypothetical protein
VNSLAAGVLTESCETRPLEKALAEEITLERTVDGHHLDACRGPEPRVYVMGD